MVVAPAVWPVRAARRVGDGGRTHLSRSRAGPDTLADVGLALGPEEAVAHHDAGMKADGLARAAADRPPRQSSVKAAISSGSRIRSAWPVTVTRQPRNVSGSIAASQASTALPARAGEMMGGRP